MKKLIKTAAVLLMPTAMFAQIDGPHSHDRDSITISRYELQEIIGTLEDVLEWQQQDIDEGKYFHGSYEEMWGSNYWLTLMAIELRTKL
tara:strand:+ start:79 stop:345 length:267 start_codon:yes stop_codon:yes gene_type:complete